MRLSSFATRFTRPTGALELMDDLGLAMAGDTNTLMLGGGNPGRIGAVRELFMQRLSEVARQPDEFDRMFANYAPPAGEIQFRRALAKLFRDRCGWPVTEHNITLTAGSQFGFFLLFNLLAGEFDDGSYRQILLPVTPEYIGYKDLGLKEGLFSARRPTIEELPDKLFKYHVDFEGLDIDSGISAICVSRPTNPTGNVITDDELARLDVLARQQGVPLVVDNAYGLPFPGMVFVEATACWNENTVLCMSLSKLGLPGIRTGIIVADEALSRALASCTAIMNLSVSSVGAALIHNLVESGEIIEIGQRHIRPFYEQKALAAADTLRQAMDGYPLRIHRPEGAMFLWAWFPELPIASAELYQRLKDRGVLVISGHHFFPGLEEPWPHKDQCLRLSYAQDSAAVNAGLKIVAEEAKRAYQQAGNNG